MGAYHSNDCITKLKAGNQQPLEKNELFTENNSYHKAKARHTSNLTELTFDAMTMVQLLS